MYNASKFEPGLENTPFFGWRCCCFCQINLGRNYRTLAHFRKPCDAQSSDFLFVSIVAAKKPCVRISLLAKKRECAKFLINFLWEEPSRKIQTKDNAQCSQHC